MSKIRWDEPHRTCSAKIGVYRLRAWEFCGCYELEPGQRDAYWEVTVLGSLWPDHARVGWQGKAKTISAAKRAAAAAMRWHKANVGRKRVTP